MTPKPPDRDGDEVTPLKPNPPVALVTVSPKLVEAKVDETIPNEELPNPEAAEAPKTVDGVPPVPGEAGIINEKDAAFPGADEKAVPNDEDCELLPEAEELNAGCKEVPNAGGTTELNGCAGWDEVAPNTGALAGTEDPNTDSALKLNALLLPPPVAKPDFPVLDVCCAPNPGEALIWLEVFINSAISDALDESCRVFS